MSDLKPLTPPDPARCQAEVIEYRPFVMGGNVHNMTRCQNKPHWLAREVKPGADGRMGSMTMCDQCCAIFINKGILKPDAYELDWIDL